MVPACERALNMAKDALMKQGHDIVDMQLPDMQAAWKLALAAAYMDNGDEVARIIKDDIADADEQWSYDLCGANPTVSKFRDVNY